MARKERVAEYHFYEWRMAAWAMSETRGRLMAAGRGIYRELLDYCYAQGHFPTDRGWICRQCACSEDELDLVWPIIKKHFPITKKGGYHHNKIADVQRANYFRYVSSQRNKRKQGLTKANESIQLDDGGQGSVDKHFNRILTKIKEKVKIKEKLTQEVEPVVDSGEDPFDCFRQMFCGPIPENCWQVFGAQINTSERLAALLKNTPLWMKVGKYKTGYVDANQYLKSGIWLDPPKAELLAESRASPSWAQKSEPNYPKEML